MVAGSNCNSVGRPSQTASVRKFCTDPLRTPSSKLAVTFTSASKEPKSELVDDRPVKHRPLAMPT